MARESEMPQDDNIKRTKLPLVQYTINNFLYSFDRAGFFILQKFNF